MFAQRCKTPLASSGHPADLSPMTIPADAPRDILRHPLTWRVNTMTHSVTHTSRAPQWLL